MSGRRSRTKGARAELEVARILTAAGFPARRTPNSGGLAIKGDLTGSAGEPCIPGYALEVKRQERLNIPAWLRQAHADAGGNVPLLVFRCNAKVRSDPLNTWHVCLPLEDLLGLLVERRPRELET